MALKDDLKVIAPEFASADDTRLDTFIGWASLRVNRRVFGGKANLATVLLAAHMLTRFPSTGAGASPTGAITSESVGQISSSYSDLSSVGNPEDAELKTTVYGAQFASIKRAVLATPLVV